VARFHEVLGASDEPDVGAGGTTFDVRARITSLRLLQLDGAPTTHVASGDEVVAQIDVEFDREVVDPIVGFNVANEAGIHAYASHSPLDAHAGRRFGPGDRATFEATVTMRLTTGSYTIGMNLVDGASMLPAAIPPRRWPFYVANPSAAQGIADLAARFGEVDGPR
jgi:hypothetical protein